MTENTENTRRYVTREDSEEDFLKLVEEPMEELSKERVQEIVNLLDPKPNSSEDFRQLVMDSSPDIKAILDRDQKVLDEITGMVKPIAFKSDFDEAYFVREYVKSVALGLLAWTALGFVARIVIRMIEAKNTSK